MNQVWGRNKPGAGHRSIHPVHTQVLNIHLSPWGVSSQLNVHVCGCGGKTDHLWRRCEPHKDTFRAHSHSQSLPLAEELKKSNWQGWKVASAFRQKIATKSFQQVPLLKEASDHVQLRALWGILQTLKPQQAAIFSVVQQQVETIFTCCLSMEVSDPHTNVYL